MILLIKLFLAHLIGDFLLQPKSWVAEKEQKKAASPKLYLHVLLHASITWLFLWDWNLWPIALSVGIIHFIIDLIKLYFQKKETATRWFFIDQILHSLSLIVLWYIWFDSQLSVAWIFRSPVVWLYVTAILFLSTASDIIIRVFLSGWSERLTDKSNHTLMDAGKYIGILERLLGFVFIITAHWEGLGFLLAAKSIFRFGDLKESRDRNLTEYVLIGTLLSFGITVAIGLLVLSVNSKI